MKKMSGDAYVAIGIMLVSLFFLLYSLTYPSVKTKLLPEVVSALVFILASIQLKNELLTKKNNFEGVPDKIDNKTKDCNIDFDGIAPDTIEWWRKNLTVFGWLVGLFLLIYLFGFIISILIFVALFLKVNNRGWLKSIITSILTAMIIYTIFIYILKADLFSGIIAKGLLHHLG